MKFQEYALKASETAIYPGSGEWGGLYYTVSELAGELGECKNIMKKVHREGMKDKYRDKMVGELGGVMWAWSQMWNELGLIGELEKVDFPNGYHVPTGLPSFNDDWYANVDKTLICIHSLLSDMCADACNYEVGLVNHGYPDRIAKSWMETLPYYVQYICTLLGFTIEDVMVANINLLSARKDAGTITGSGDGVDGRNDG